MKERKRGLDDDDDSDVNTARSSGQSATKAPEEKSHLSLPRLFSRSSFPTGFLFPPHAWPPRRHTVMRARASPTRTTYPPMPLPPISLPRANHPIVLFLSFSFTSIGYYIFHRNECADTARPTTAKLFADAHTSARDRACGYTGFAAAAAVVSVYVSVGEKWEMGHATRALVGERGSAGVGHARSPFVRSSGLPHRGAPFFSLCRTSCALVLSFSTPFSSLVSASQSRIVCFSIFFDCARYLRFLMRFIRILKVSFGLQKNYFDFCLPRNARLSSKPLNMSHGHSSRYGFFANQ